MQDTSLEAADIEFFKNASGEVKKKNFRKLPAKDIKGPEDVKFIDCDFSGADFTGANLAGLKFESCTFQSTTFSAAKLHFAEFKDTKDFTGSIFEDCKAEGVKFINCDLTDIDARNSRLKGLEVVATHITRTNFENCDLSGYKGLVSDDTVFRNATLLPSATAPFFSTEGLIQRAFGTHIEPWQYLRSKFTGLNLFLSILPAIIIVFSLLVKLAFALAVSVLSQEDPAQFLEACFSSSEACQTQPLWWVLGGFGESVSAAVFVLFSLVHNGFRFFVTKRVDQLSRQEDANGRTPSGTSYQNLRTLAYVLCVTQILMLILFAVNLYGLSISEVPAPSPES